MVGQNFTGYVNASGGVPNYTFTVNGVTIPTNNNQVSIGLDNLSAWNSGGNTLTIGGSPTSTGTIQIPVSVRDSTGTSVGPTTYTVTVSAASALSIQSTSLPGALDGWAYNTYIKANGGVQPYTWSVISGLSSLNGAGFTFTGNPPNNNSNAEISGTPSATATINLHGSSHR